MLNADQTLQGLLTPELGQTIATLARQEGQTMLAWVEQRLREAIRGRSQAPDNSKFSRRLKTLERLKQQHADYLAQHSSPQPIDTVAILDQLRDERDAELLANCRTERSY